MVGERPEDKFIVYYSFNPELLNVVIENVSEYKIEWLKASL